MKVVLDANVYVSSMLNKQGNPKRVIDGWQRGTFDVLITSAILDEIGRVLRYPRIVKRHKQVEPAIQRFLKLLEDKAITVEPGEELGVVKDDESDNRYLECAVAGKAQFVISGDNHLLAIGEYRSIVILSPAAFVAAISLDS